LALRSLEGALWLTLCLRPTSTSHACAGDRRRKGRSGRGPSVRDSAPVDFDSG
jgi:hypothetical protein